MDVENRPADGRISATMKFNARSGVSRVGTRVSRQVSGVQVLQDRLHMQYKTPRIG
jgi:hypothetical protein